MNLGISNCLAEGEGGGEKTQSTKDKLVIQLLQWTYTPQKYLRTSTYVFPLFNT